MTDDSTVQAEQLPPKPFLSQEHHGKLIIMAMLVYAGDVAKGEQRPDG